jgi:hypothetical protein
MSVGLWCVAGFDCCTLTKAFATVNAFRPLHLWRHVGFTCVYIGGRYERGTEVGSGKYLPTYLP